VVGHGVAGQQPTRTGGGDLLQPERVAVINPRHVPQLEFAGMPGPPAGPGLDAHGPPARRPQPQQWGERFDELVGQLGPGLRPAIPRSTAATVPAAKAGIAH